jgi:hypothetical protein
MRPDDEAKASGPVTQVGVALASLAEGWLRDAAMCGVVLLSLGVLLAGLSADDGVWVATGVVLGLAGPWWPSYRRSGTGGPRGSG